MLSINHKETVNSDYPIITLMLSINHKETVNSDQCINALNYIKIRGTKTHCINNKVYKRVNKEGVREPKRWFKRGKSKWQSKYIVQDNYKIKGE